MLSALRPLLPRLYSISSSQLEDPGRVQVTVAVVRYESLNRHRIGVTSTQLAERIQVPAYQYSQPSCFHLKSLLGEHCSVHAVTEPSSMHIEQERMQSG